MRAVTMLHGRLELKEIPEPPMTDDHLLVEPLAAGVCGGDLNAMEHADEFLHASRASGTPLFLFDPDRDLVFGHEFTARIAEVGANVEGYSSGDLIARVARGARSARRRALRRLRERLSGGAGRAGGGVAVRARADPRWRLALRGGGGRPARDRPQ